MRCGEVEENVFRNLNPGEKQSEYTDVGEKRTTFSQVDISEKSLLGALVELKW